MSDAEAELSRLTTACDRVVEAIVDLEACEGGIRAALVARKPKSRAELLDRIEQARDALADLLAEAGAGPVGAAARPTARRRAGPAVHSRPAPPPGGREGDACL